MNKSKNQLKNDWRRLYFEGEISLDEYINHLLNSPAGDRTRKKIEKKHNDIVHKRELQFK